MYITLLLTPFFNVYIHTLFILILKEHVKNNSSTSLKETKSNEDFKVEVKKVTHPHRYIFTWPFLEFLFLSKKKGG